YQKGEGFSDLADVYDEVLVQYSRYMGHVAANVGGMNENFKTYDQTGKVYDFVSKDKQREAILFFNQQLFTTPAWLVDNQELAKFDNGVMITRIKNVQ